MRMFDHDLAQRVERRLGLGHSRSVSMLVAPAIAAAVANRRKQVTIPAGRRVLLLTEVTVEPGSVADGRRLGELDEAERAAGARAAGSARALGVESGVRTTGPGRHPVGGRGDPSGLARLLMVTRAQRNVGRVVEDGPVNVRSVHGMRGQW